MYGMVSAMQQNQYLRYIADNFINISPYKDIMMNNEVLNFVFGIQEYICPEKSLESLSCAVVPLEFKYMFLFENNDIVSFFARYRVDMTFDSMKLITESRGYFLITVTFGLHGKYKLYASYSCEQNSYVIINAINDILNGMIKEPLITLFKNDYSTYFESILGSWESE